MDNNTQESIITQFDSLSSNNTQESDYTTQESEYTTQESDYTTQESEYTTQESDYTTQESDFTTQDFLGYEGMCLFNDSELVEDITPPCFDLYCDTQECQGDSA